MQQCMLYSKYVLVDIIIDKCIDPFTGMSMEKVHH